MREKILDDLKNAMKSQNKERLSVIRMVKASIQMDELNLKRELNDDEVLSIISKQIKTRKESILEFEKASRNDLIEKTQSEINILTEYLPEQLKEDEIDKIINEVFEQVNPQHPSDIGKIMSLITPRVKGRADMKTISSKIKEKLNK